jgi:spore germination protein KB
MFQNGKISPHQIKVLIILSYIGAYILNIPSVLAVEAKQDAWIAAILGTINSVLIMLLYSSLGTVMKNATPIQYCKKLFGSWLGGLIAFSFVIFLLCNTLVFVWIVGDFMITQLMPETPMIVINLLFTVIILFAARLGLEATARAAEVLFPWVIIGIISLFLFILPDVELQRLLPISDNGIKPVLHGLLLFNSFIPLTQVIILMIYPSSVNNIKESKKSLISGMLMGGIIISLVVIFSILILGAEATGRNTYPVYALAKKISIGNILERLEAITAMVWIVALFFQGFLYFYGSAVALAETFGMKGYKPLTMPLSLLIVIFSVVIFPNTTYATEWDKTTYVSYSLIYGLLFPLLLLIIGKLKK